MTFINCDDFSFLLVTRLTHPTLVQIPGRGESSLPSWCGAAATVPGPRPRRPALPQPPAWTRTLRTPGPRPRVPD